MNQHQIKSANSSISLNNNFSISQRESVNDEDLTPNLSIKSIESPLLSKISFNKFDNITEGSFSYCFLENEKSEIRKNELNFEFEKPSFTLLDQGFLEDSSQESFQENEFEKNFTVFKNELEKLLKKCEYYEKENIKMKIDSYFQTFHQKSEFHFKTIENIQNTQNQIIEKKFGNSLKEYEINSCSEPFQRKGTSLLEK